MVTFKVGQYGDYYGFKVKVIAKTKAGTFIQHPKKRNERIALIKKGDRFQLEKISKHTIK